MADVLIRVPRRTKRVNIIKSKELIEREIARARYVPPPLEPVILPPTPEEIAAIEKKERDKLFYAKTKIEEVEDIEVVELKDMPKPLITQTFTICNSKEPTEISLKNISTDTITIDEAMIEVQSSYDSGFKHGQETTKAEFHREIDRQNQWVRSIDNVVNNMRLALISEMQVFEDILIETATSIAEKITLNEIDKHENYIVKQVKNALELLPNEKILEVRVNPKDYKVIKNSQADIVHDPTRLRGVEFLPDLEINMGECIVKTVAGNIETRVKNQLEKVSQELHRAMKNPNYFEDKLSDEEAKLEIDRTTVEDKPKAEDKFEKPNLTKLDLFKDY